MGFDGLWCLTGFQLTMDWLVQKVDSTWKCIG
jgi:hypothetical protein